MPRKPNVRTAASSAAAAANSTTPTFTSFAAATAQALRAHDMHASAEVEPLPVTTAWDESALALVKKLTKRDATTKTRALSELTEYVGSASEDVGGAFITAWPSAFKNILDDPAPAVRISALNTMAEIVFVFGRRTQPALPAVIPYWIAATGDSSRGVVTAAVSSLDRAFPPPEKRRKAATRFAPRIKNFCTDLVARLMKTKDLATFSRDAARLIAAIHWLLSAANDIGSVASILDASNDPLRVALRAPGCRGKIEDAGDTFASAPTRAVADLAIDVVRLTMRSLQQEESSKEVDNSTSAATTTRSAEARIARIAKIAVDLACTRVTDAAVWDLLLVLLTDAPSHLEPVRNKLAGALGTAATTADPAALNALLSLIAAMRPVEVAPEFAHAVLTPILKQFFPADFQTAVSNAYMLSAFPSFVETIAYVQASADTSWFSNPDDGKRFALDWFHKFSTPVCLAFIAGLMPPVSSRMNIELASRKSSPIDSGASSAHNVLTSVAMLFRHVPTGAAEHFFSDVVDALFNNLTDQNQISIVRRYGELLDLINDAQCEAQLSKTVIQAALQSEGAHMKNRFCVVSVTLSKRGGRNLFDLKLDKGDQLLGLVDKLIGFSWSACKLFIKEDGTVQDEEFKSMVACTGVVCSWVTWVSRQLPTLGVSQLMFRTLNEIVSPWRPYEIFTEMLLAHRRQKSLTHFQPWNAVEQKYLQTIIGHAMNIIGTDNDRIFEAVQFLVAVIDPNGGAENSLRTSLETAAVISARVIEDPELDVFDPLIIAIFESRVQFSDTKDEFEKLVYAAFLRSIMSEKLLSMLVCCLSVLAGGDVVSQIKTIISRIDEYEHLDHVSIGISLGRLISLVGEYDIHDSVSVCKSLLSSVPISVSQPFLEYVRFEYVFGEGDQCNIQVEQLLDVFERGHLTSNQDMLNRLNDYLDSINNRATAKVVSSVTDFLLRGMFSSAEDIITTVCTLQSKLNMEDGTNLSFIAIEDKILQAMPRTETTLNTPELAFTRVPHIVRTCVIASGGSIVSYLKNALTAASNVIRTDPSSDSAMVALDMLSASLAPRHMTKEALRSATKYPPWLMELTKTTSVGTRRCLQQPRGLSKANVEVLASHCACFVYHCVETLGQQSVSSDCIRFWTLFPRGELEKFYKRASSDKNSVTSQFCTKVAWLCQLACKLVEGYDDGEDGRAELVDFICHKGAWLTVYLLPGFSQLQENPNASTYAIYDNVNSDGCATLLLKAAERGVLLGEDGIFPVRRELIYRLLPWLRSESNLVRKAVLTLLAHVAAVDLPDIVIDSYPDDGFADESTEIAYAVETVPQELRDGLRWLENTGEVATHELGYFLTWRLFLDLMQSVNESQDSTGLNVGGEDVSFRRVGVVFLRAHSDLYAEFFKRCLDVVVDGTIVERTNAGAAAEEALQIERKAAQGIQLVHQAEEEDARREENTGANVNAENSSLENLEAEIGRAAGIAFARALQRLPALSREFIAERIDRGMLLRTEAFIRKRVSPLLIKAELQRVREWGAFGGGSSGNGGKNGEGDGEVETRGSVNEREVRATYTFCDVTLEIGMRLPDEFPLRTVVVEARSSVGMSEARWRKTLLAMTTLLRVRDGTLAEAVELWRRNLDKTFEGTEECPICYSVLHISTASLPRKQCSTCKKLFHIECLHMWFRKSGSKSCPLCRSFLH